MINFHRIKISWIIYGVITIIAIGLSVIGYSYEYFKIKGLFSFFAQLSITLFGFYLAAISLVAFEKEILENKDLEVLLLVYKIIRIMGYSMLTAAITFIFAIIGMVFEFPIAPKEFLDVCLGAIWWFALISMIILMFSTIVVFLGYTVSIILEKYYDAKKLIEEEKRMRREEMKKGLAQLNDRYFEK